jgi:hypothetical protein
MTRVLTAIVIGLGALSPAHADTVYCSTFAGYRTCSTPGNTYHSMEWENGGRTYGEDSQNNKWMTTPGQWGDTTINRRVGQ